MYAVYILTVVAPACYTSEVDVARRASIRIIADHIRCLPTPDVAHCHVRVDRRVFTTERDRAQARIALTKAERRLFADCPERALIIVDDNAHLHNIWMQREDAIRHDIDVLDSDDESDDDIDIIDSDDESDDDAMVLQVVKQPMVLRPRRNRAHKYGVSVITE